MYKPSCAFQVGRPMEDVNWFVCCVGDEYSVLMAGACPLRRCGERKRESCPALLWPVCAVKADGGQGTYDNSCQACEDGEVVSYYNGSCVGGNGTGSATNTTLMNNGNTTSTNASHNNSSNNSNKTNKKTNNTQ